MPYKTWTNHKTGKTYTYFAKPNNHREGHKRLGKRVGEHIARIEQELSDKLEIPPERIQVRVKGIRIIRPETLKKMQERGKMLYREYGPSGKNKLWNYRTMKEDGRLTPAFIAYNAKKAGQKRTEKALKRAYTWNDYEAAKIGRRLIGIPKYSGRYYKKHAARAGATRMEYMAPEFSGPGYGYQRPDNWNSDTFQWPSLRPKEDTMTEVSYETPLLSDRKERAVTKRRTRNTPY